MKVLDFDIETIAAGFGEPDWVPQKITCVAWAWVDEADVQVRVCGPEGIFGQPGKRVEMLLPLLAAIRSADRITGHNILRFDLKVLNAECLRLNLEPLPSLLVHDTMRIPKAKGYKKGQDNLERDLGAKTKKQAMSWGEWQDSYDEEGWPRVKSRCVTDVEGHMQIYAEMKERGWLKPPVPWNP